MTIQGFVNSRLWFGIGAITTGAASVTNIVPDPSHDSWDTIGAITFGALCLIFAYRFIRGGRASDA
jgi:hypothetical protein